MDSTQKRYYTFVRHSGGVSQEPFWARFSDEQLLDLRLCDLKLKEKGPLLDSCIGKLQQELARKNLRLKPHCWLGEEWFVADGIPGIAIPFYLAHPRLRRLEGSQMLEIEGGSSEWCMKIVRHEMGHVIDTAYRLSRRKVYQETFGNAFQRYPESYRPDPYSRDFVLHLDRWYAQSHPAEDFAETFAVWLNPQSPWRKRYRGWGALDKLSALDGLMQDLAGKTPTIRTRRNVEPISELRHTLREHYARKRKFYSVRYPALYDQDLHRVFSDTTSEGADESAAAFLRRHHSELRSLVVEKVDEHPYTVEQMIQRMKTRCRQLKLRVDQPNRRALTEVRDLLARQTRSFVKGRHQRLAL